MKMHRIRVLLVFCFHLWTSGAVDDGLCNSSEGGGVWRTGMTLDIPGSQSNGALLGVTLSYVTGSANQCGAECCKQFQGTCDVAIYNQNDTLCSHYHCSPIDKCKITAHNETDIFFPILSPGSDVMSAILDLDNNSMTFNSTLVVNPSSLGDGGRSKARKGALPDQVPNEGGQLKQDNTSVVARKGVVESSPTLEDESDLGNESSDLLVNGSGISFNNATNFYVLNFTQIESDGNGSFLQQQVTSGHRLEVVTSSTAAIPKVVSVEGHFTTGRPVTTSTTTVKPVTSVYSTAKPVGSFSSELPVTGNHRSDPLTLTEKEETFSELMHSGAFHLVIGLALGLLVLLSVIGLLAKRVHDSWQRRHYHRMDFLIDGMYHGEN